MAHTIFFSWQSDSPTGTNRNFIEDALKKAVNVLTAEANVEAAEREEQFLVDKDTQGVAGSPPIVDTILEKISKCGIFVPDLTIVAVSSDGRKLPNPNVLIEYGYAVGKVRHHRVIPIMNTAFFEPTPESLPFDMRHLRKPLCYRLAPDADPAERKRVKEALVDQLAEAIRLIVNGGHLVQAGPAPSPFKEAEPKEGRSSFVAREDKLLTLRDPFGADPPRDIYPMSGAHMYLRLMPRYDPGKEWAPAELERAVTSFRDQGFKLLPLGGGGRGFDYGVNGRGFVVFTTLYQNDASRFVQVFRSGEIWAVDAIGLRSWNEERPKSPIPVGFEKSFSEALNSYRSFAMERLGLKAPYKWIAGMRGIEEREIVLPPPPPGRSRFRDTAGSCVVDQIEKSGLIDSKDDAFKTLMPFFETVWGECGIRREEIWGGG